MRAAAALGPKTAIPRWRSSSASPATSGASGPTTTRSTPSSAASGTSAAGSLRARRMAVGERCDSRVARCGVQLGVRPLARERPDERVLATARPDDEHLHGGDRNGGSRRAPPARAPPRSIRFMEAPPYSAAEVDVVRLPDGRRERDRVAVEEPLEIRIGGRPRRGDDADARARRGARARLLPLRGAAAGGGAPPRRPRREHRRGRRARLRREPRCSEASTRPRPAASAARARSRRSRSTRRASSPSSACRSTSSRRCPTGSATAQAAFAVTGRPARDRALRRRTATLAVRARGRGPPQRVRQGDRLGVRRGTAAARRARSLCVSGRLSFELVQKAAVAGVPRPRGRRRARRASRSSSPRTAASRCAASSATGARTSTRSRGESR